jgi:hypothetical protein
MPTLFEYFRNDFRDSLGLGVDIPLTIQYFDQTNKTFKEDTINVHEEIRHYLPSSIRMFTYYIPSVPDPSGIIVALLNNLEQSAKSVETLNTFGTFQSDILIGTDKVTYSNRIYFYTETPLSKEQLFSLEKISMEKGLYLTFRSTEYIETKMALDIPLAFISHDSRDKEQIARVLSNGLNTRLCTVWYDEYSLKIGDSLRESIEKGIKEAKKCVLILTKNYLTNPGWGKKEFSSIFTREMIMNERIILPIWYGVTKEEIYEYSPSLVDTFALQWPSSSGKSEVEYKREIEELISKVHTAITPLTQN